MIAEIMMLVIGVVVGGVVTSLILKGKIQAAADKASATSEGDPPALATDSGCHLTSAFPRFDGGCMHDKIVCGDERRKSFPAVVVCPKKITHTPPCGGPGR